MANYIDEMKYCIETGRKLKLSHSARTLWQTLVHLNNGLNDGTYWSEWFDASQSLLADYTALSVHTILDAREELKALGIIEYKSESGTTTRYKLKRSTD